MDGGSSDKEVNSASNILLMDFTLTIQIVDETTCGTVSFYPFTAFISTSHRHKPDMTETTPTHKNKERSTHRNTMEWTHTH